MPLQTMTVQIAGQKTRRETLHGVVYLVAPVVPIVAGVLNEYLIPEDEIAAFIEAWNGIPLPLGHPKNDYGEYISANAPALVAQSVGRFFHARMDGPRLTGELWLDVVQCTRLGGDAVECVRRLEAGEPLEVSTAFFPETTAQQGIFNGSKYIGVHRHLRPDHLALLPNGVGACSWADGCGAPRTHAAPQCDCAHCQGETDMTLQAHAAARRPTFTGTERGPWTAPSFQVYTHALFSGADMPGTVAALTAIQKRQVAAHTLLGDEAGATFAALSVFPVVNPRTGKLNDRALRAVLSGRGTQADIPATTLASAQDMARGLLKSEFGVTVESLLEEGTQGRFKTAIHSILAFAMGSGDSETAPIATHLTHDDLEMSLAGALAHQQEGQYPSMQILDVEDGFVIYRQGYGDGACCYRQAYTVDATGAVALGGTPEEVQRNTQYVPIAAQTRQQPGGRSLQQQQEVSSMLTKAEIIQSLIDHPKNSFTTADATALDALTAEVLTRMLNDFGSMPTLPPGWYQASPGTASVAVPVPGESPPSTHQASPVTLEAITALLKTELDARDTALEGKLALYSRQAAESTERTQLVAHLATQGFTEQDCTGMSLEALRKIVQTVAPVSYAGMGFPAFPIHGADDDSLPPDAPDWS